ncbi:MAG: KEOPS complex kinase/ATPase Bud32 [Candidatus Aenigmarchaeota archaeon]|nr:KEOPS complex kinase/ATPase Bud32 [Candidatus Aenigmarchaeota archaeon]MDW8149674.1 KEOPS complex kinase/ATPase Bud32 [Candidatus Aenigmarchaeota archaeon]
MKVIKRGAEAIIYLDSKMIIKERIKKGYRLKEIDEELRRKRTRKEAKIINDVRRLNINVPKIFEIDEKNCKIVMEFIDGVVLKDFINKIDKEEIEEIFFKIGKDIGKMHSSNIVHGDLTTSNMILKNDEIFFIDFGLANYSNKIEDKAVDLRLMYEALKSVHFKVLDIAWKSFLKGYSEEFKEYKKVVERFEEIKKRVRYVERK